MRCSFASHGGINRSHQLPLRESEEAPASSAPQAAQTIASLTSISAGLSRCSMTTSCPCYVKGIIPCALVLTEDDIGRSLQRRIATSGGKVMDRTSCPGLLIVRAVHYPATQLAMALSAAWVMVRP